MPPAERHRTPLTDISRFVWRSIASTFVLVGVVAAQADKVPARLREIRIVTADVFDDSNRRLLARLANALHWQTRTEVIERELWVRRGSVVDDALAAELERHLRALGLFADVVVRLVATEQPDLVDLEIVTRDRLTLNSGAGASYVGGVTGVRASIGENNLLGLGDRVSLSFTKNSEGEYRGGFSYTDLQLFDTWHTATVRGNQTDEGQSLGLTVRRPFQHLADPRAHGFALAHDEAAVDYFRGGESVAEVPFVRNSLAGDVTWASGTRDARRYLGLGLSFDDTDYEPATGPLAPEIRVPGDVQSLFVGPSASWQWIDGYREVEGLDTLSYVQDLTLGVTLGATLGVRWRDEAGRSGELQPEANVHGAWTSELAKDLYASLGARGGARLNDGETVGWFASGAARAFALLTDSHTLAASCTFDAVEESQDLRRELTLGEDNGLRGYRARFFAGTRQLRTNLEHRFDSGLEFATLRFGTVLFFDVGHVGDGSDLGRPFSAAGCGLRIGSKSLLGEGVFRIDLAKPLSEVDGEGDGWRLSLSVGQVFTWGGNAASLARQ